MKSLNWKSAVHLILWRLSKLASHIIVRCYVQVLPRKLQDLARSAHKVRKGNIGESFRFLANNFIYFVCCLICFVCPRTTIKDQFLLWWIIIFDFNSVQKQQVSTKIGNGWSAAHYRYVRTLSVINTNSMEFWLYNIKHDYRYHELGSGRLGWSCWLFGLAWVLD